MGVWSWSGCRPRSGMIPGMDPVAVDVDELIEFWTRLGRAIRHLSDQMSSSRSEDIGLRSLQETIDTTSPGGRLVFHVFAALTELRDLITEHTNVGLAAARARGRTGGRPSALSADQVKTARRLYSQQDMTVAQIGDVLGVSRTTIYRTLNRHPAPNPARRRPRPTRTT